LVRNVLLPNSPVKMTAIVSREAGDVMGIMTATMEVTSWPAHQQLYHRAMGSSVPMAGVFPTCGDVTETMIVGIGMMKLDALAMMALFVIIPDVVLLFPLFVMAMTTVGTVPTRHGNQECPDSNVTKATPAFQSDGFVTELTTVETARTNDGNRECLVSNVLEPTPASMKGKSAMEMIIAEMDLMNRKKSALVLKEKFAVRNHPVQMFLDHVSHQNGFVTRMVFGIALMAQTRPTVQ